MKIVFKPRLKCRLRPAFELSLALSLQELKFVSNNTEIELKREKKKDLILQGDRKTNDYARLLAHTINSIITCLEISRQDKDRNKL